MNPIEIQWGRPGSGIPTRMADGGYIETARIVAEKAMQATPAEDEAESDGEAALTGTLYATAFVFGFCASQFLSACGALAGY